MNLWLWHRVSSFLFTGNIWLRLFKETSLVVVLFGLPPLFGSALKTWSTQFACGREWMHFVNYYADSGKRFTMQKQDKHVYFAKRERTRTEYSHYSWKYSHGSRRGEEKGTLHVPIGTSYRMDRRVRDQFSFIRSIIRHPSNDFKVVFINVGKTAG